MTQFTDTGLTVRASSRVEFTDEHRKILAEARKLRPECVLERCPYGTYSFWRNSGPRWDGAIRDHGTAFANGLGGESNGRPIEKLLDALRESRILGLDSPDTLWVDDIAREHGVPITWRESHPAKAEGKWEPRVGEMCSGNPVTF